MGPINLLVTGGAGFVGANFVRHALRHKCVAKLINVDCLTYAADLNRLGDAERDERYLLEAVDICQADELARIVREHEINWVAHLAAETHVDRSIAKPADFVNTNITGTFHLLEACRAVWGGGQGRFLYVSTDEVCGSLEPGEPDFTEDSPLRPNSPYAASKAGAECLVRSYGVTYGLATIISRCTNNYGPGQNAEKLIPLAISRIKARQPIPVYGDGSNVRDWLHVQDHCEALWEVLTRGDAGAVYHIGGGQALPNLELVETLCDIADEMVPAYGLGGGSRGLISFVQDRPGHDRRYALNCGRIKAQLGWQARRTLAEGLRETVRWHLGVDR